MKRITSIAVIVVSALFVGLAFCEPGEPTAYQRVHHHYEAIRQALLQETIEGIDVCASEIRKASEDVDSLDDSIEPEQKAVSKKVVADIHGAADRLARVTSLVEAREGFGILSEHLIRYQQLSSAGDSLAVYCSMVKKSWLQPQGEIGNPYVEPSMASCGEPLSK